MAKVAIVGSGAMGSVYAGLFASAGHEVHAVSLWQDHIDAINLNGLRVEGVSGDRTVRLSSASTSTKGIGICDLVIIATKAFDVEAAAHAALDLIGDKTVVQTLQNGIGSADKVAPIVGPDRLVIGVVGGFGASRKAPGHVHHNGMEVTWFGAYRNLPRERLEYSVSIWESAGFNARIFADTQQMVWQKFIMNVTFSGSTTLTGMTIGQVMKDPNAWSVARKCGEEAIAVSRALGVNLDLHDPVEHIMELGAKIPNARPSMLLDHLAGLRGEVDVINGSVPRLGREVGVATPVNDTVIAIIKARESLFNIN